MNATVEQSGENTTKQIKYYALEKIDKDTILAKMNTAVKYLQTQNLPATKSCDEFVEKMFDNEEVSSMLIHISRLAVFNKEFAEAFKENLDLLATAKKLKYFTNLSLAHNALLLRNLGDNLGVPCETKEQVEKLFQTKAALGDVRLKDYMATSKIAKAQTYLQNDKDLESIDPHSVYPTSIYRHCDGVTMASPDSQTIEAVMSTSITTTIKITRGILEPTNPILAEVYKPLGRCVAVVDDKVEKLFGDALNKYFSANDIPLVMLVHSGNEIDKDIRNVENVLVDLKNNGVARNEPVLVVGGGVIADIAGFATALYHRNTPYVMLCTSIVTGIDAGPSPRTCCDGYGFKNLYGAYHPPVLTLTDRFFWKTLHEGWIRHGIAEIIKMACVKDYPLFCLVEKAGTRLIRTKFGTEGCDDDDEFQDLCDAIVGKAMESYVKSEYGNLWETHQCRPHAFGHTWSPGYELPAGMLHGHAVASCMGYGSFLARKRDWLSQEQFERILKLISDMELTLWHPIMDNHGLVQAANKKAHAKRGGNLCAPVPKGEIGLCGYINDHKHEDVPPTMNEYKAFVQKYVRGGEGIDMHCHDVGLEDPSTVAGDALTAIGQSAGPSAVPTNYEEWIKAEQTKRNSTWENNVNFKVADDTAKPAKFDKFTLFNEGAESYAMAHTSVASQNIQNASLTTEKEKLFMPCMVGSMESQFLKMQAQIKGAKRCLDIGTFTGMSAIALAEGVPQDGKVVTLEFNADIAKVAQQIFADSNVGSKIDVRIGAAADAMKKMIQDGEKFDLIFIDADKENYIEYYELSLQLLESNGIILADNSLCALLYDQDGDVRSTKLHEFNQHVKNDKRTEQVVLTIREGITLIKPVV